MKHTPVEVDPQPVAITTFGVNDELVLRQIGLA